MIDKNTIYSYFQTDDFPTEDQFRATWDSFWHKSESIPMSSISGLNQLFQQTATVAQLNNKANVDGSNIDVSAYQEKLNITNLIATAKEEVKTELLNGAPEAFDTLKEISDWISDDETAEGAILQAIQNEATARTEADNQKLDKGNYIGTAQDLYNYFEDKIDADYNCIPVVGNGASGKVLTYSVVSQVYGKVGIGIAGEASEKLEVGGNIKANSYKFTLPSVLTPQPNMLIAKTDGSGLIWYNNSSVRAEIPSYSSPTNGYVARWDGVKFVNGSIQDDGINIGVGTAFDTNTLPARVKINPNNQKYFNLPLSSLSTVKPTTINVGDFYTAHNRLWFKVNDNNFAPATNYDTEIKVLGFQYDFRGDSQFNATQNFNAIHSNNPRFGKSAIVNTGLYYGKTIGNIAPSSVGVDSRMYEGWLHSIDRSYVSGVQYFIDATGQFFVRSLGGQYHSSTTWGKAVLEKQNTTTQLEEKLALARVKLKSYTKLERNALTVKEVGEVIWQTDSGNSGIRVYDGTNWLAVQTTID